jgi:hypothetical protein
MEPRSLDALRSELFREHYPDIEEAKPHPSEKTYAAEWLAYFR